MNVWQSRQQDRLLPERGGQLVPSRLSGDPAGARGCFCSRSGEKPSTTEVPRGLQRFARGWGLSSCYGSATTELLSRQLSIARRR